MKLIAGLVALGLLSGGCSLTRKLVYHPGPMTRGAPPIAALSPDELESEDVSFEGAEGARLHGVLARWAGARRAILFCHGEPEEELVQADARAALATLGRATNVPASRVVVVGQSLGGAVATDLAWSVPEVGGLVVLSSFTCVDDITQDLAALPLGFLVPESWDSIEKIAAIPCRKLIVHGRGDDVIPFEHGERLHAAAREPKRFLALEHADHFLPLWRDSETVAAIASLVAEVPE